MPKTINTVHIKWYFVRVAALLTIPAIILDLETVFLIQGLLLIHIRIGLESIIYDYVHSYITRAFYLSLIRILTLEGFFCLIELTL